MTEYVDDPILVPIAMLAGTDARQGTLLDVGCGEGRAMKVICFTDSVIGIDPNKSAIQKAKQYGDVVVGVGEYLPFQEKVIDMMLMEGMLHHSNNVYKCLDESNRCLKNYGFLAISEACGESPILRIGRLIHPYWEGNIVTHRLTSTTLKERIYKSGFHIVQEKRSGLVAWILSSNSAIFNVLEKIEGMLHRFLWKWSVHYILLVNPLIIHPNLNIRVCKNID